MNKYQSSSIFFRAACVMLGILSLPCILAQTVEADSPDDEFKIVTIGTQQWMAENLNVGTFRNGEAIPEAKTVEQWKAAYYKEEAAWCYYNNDPSNGEKFGRLYNWYAVNDPRGIAPAGWHVPSDKEWAVLIDFLGGDNIAGPKMKSAGGWLGDGSGNNSSGFSALPCGERHYKDAGFYKNGEIGFWWSATKNDKWNAWYRAIHSRYAVVARDNGGMNTGFSVRCIKDGNTSVDGARYIIGHFSFSVPKGWNPLSAADKTAARNEFASDLAPGLGQYIKAGEPPPGMGEFEILQKPTDGQLIGWTLIVPEQTDFMEEIFKKENVEFQKRKNLAGGQIKSGSCRLFKVNGIDVVRVDVEMSGGGQSTNMHFWSPKSPRVITTLMLGMGPHKSVQTEKEFEDIISSLMVREEMPPETGNRQIEIYSSGIGFINNIFVSKGDRVIAGETKLFELDSSRMAFDLECAKYDLEKAAALLKLEEEKAVQSGQTDKLEKARQRVAELQLHIDSLPKPGIAYAPVNGRVTEIFREAGERVNLEDIILQIQEE
jgi:uncharacterized protein (TIGR02145 family)